MFEELVKLYQNHIIATDKNIINSINRYFDIKTNISKESFINSIIDREKYYEIMITEKHDIVISNKNISGEYFPPDYDVNRNGNYNVDFIHYRISISNGEKVFHYTENLLHSVVDSVVIRGDNLMISLCSFSHDLKDDDRKMTELKTNAKKYITEIISIINEINILHKKYCDNLLSKVQSLYDNKLREEKKKEEAINKLNPFK
ncbi:MAG: hypothetical protein AB2L26_06805 [Ignavibacteria bacterium]